jgi:hypothetical protein
MTLGYLDPGTGSMILQAILGGLAAAAVFLGMFWHRVLVLLRIRKPDERADRRERAEDEPAARSFEAGEPVGKR